MGVCIIYTFVVSNQTCVILSHISCTYILKHIDRIMVRFEMEQMPFNPLKSTTNLEDKVLQLLILFRKKTYSTMKHIMLRTFFFCHSTR